MVFSVSEVIILDRVCILVAWLQEQVGVHGPLAIVARSTNVSPHIYLDPASSSKRTIAPRTPHDSTERTGYAATEAQERLVITSFPRLAGNQIQLPRYCVRPYRRGYLQDTQQFLVK